MRSRLALLDSAGSAAQAAVALAHGPKKWSRPQGTAGARTCVVDRRPPRALGAPEHGAALCVCVVCVRAGRFRARRSQGVAADQRPCEASSAAAARESLQPWALAAAQADRGGGAVGEPGRRGRRRESSRRRERTPTVLEQRARVEVCQRTRGSERVLAGGRSEQQPRPASSKAEGERERERERGGGEGDAWPRSKVRRSAGGGAEGGRVRAGRGERCRAGARESAG